MDERSFQYWRNYFLTTPDYQSRVWDFPNHQKSQVLVGNQDFRGHDTSRWWITIIDPYGGRQPFLCNREFFLYGQGTIVIYPMVLLDSQVIDAVHEYVTSQHKMDASKREAVRKFLSFVMSHGFDYSPFFYYLEKTAKSIADTYEPYATELAATLFALQTMNREQLPRNR